MVSPTYLKISLITITIIAIIFPVIFFPSYVRFVSDYNTIKYNKKDYKSECTQISNNLVAITTNFTQAPLCNNGTDNCVSHNNVTNNYTYCNNNVCVPTGLCADIRYAGYDYLDNCIDIKYNPNFFAQICTINDTINTFVEENNFENNSCIEYNNISNDYKVYDFIIDTKPRVNYFNYECVITVNNNETINQVFRYPYTGNNIRYNIDSENIELCCCNKKCDSSFKQLNQTCILNSCSANGFKNIKLFSKLGIGLAILAEAALLIIIIILAISYKQFQASNF